jgi:hypothetical protein
LLLLLHLKKKMVISRQPSFLLPQLLLHLQIMSRPRFGQT